MFNAMKIVMVMIMFNAMKPDRRGCSCCRLLARQVSPAPCWTRPSYLIMINKVRTLCVLFIWYWDHFLTSFVVWSLVLGLDPLVLLLKVLHLVCVDRVHRQDVRHTRLVYCVPIATSSPLDNISPSCLPACQSTILPLRFPPFSLFSLFTFSCLPFPACALLPFSLLLQRWVFTVAFSPLTLLPAFSLFGFLRLFLRLFLRPLFPICCSWPV